MGLYNFKAQFVPKILAGEKTHTIRATRKNPEKVGRTMHLYTGLRQKGAKLLGRFPCVKVEQIRIDHLPDRSGLLIHVDGNELSPDEVQHLARRDGFRDMDEMAGFWVANNTLPFEGHIIHWRFQR